MRRAGKTAIRRAHNPENQVQLLGLATIFALSDALWMRLGSTRPVRAVRAFLRPGVSRGWPGALGTRCSHGGELWLTLGQSENGVFFDIGQQLEVHDGPLCTVGTLFADQTHFDRRKGRREAFADAWRAA